MLALATSEIVFWLLFRESIGENQAPYYLEYGLLSWSDI
jgi:hypothetical protein